MNTSRFAAILLGVVGLVSVVKIKADVLILRYGTIVTGKVLQRDDNGVQIQIGSGTVRYPLVMVDSVRKADEETTSNRIPSWVKLISQLSTNEWAHDIKQIPATVIDNGSLQNVPYISFRCNSGGYELNIYGDLDNPARVEIGAINYLVKNNEAKTNCVNFICSVLTKDDDKSVVRGLYWMPKDIQKTNDMTFEVILPDEHDAYGGWWISVYNENEIAKARASGEELLSITQPKIKQAVSASNYIWSQTDILSYSRPSSPKSPSGGDVYVHGYYRKNGKYVAGFYRHGSI